jgi:hypothetical protein
MSPVEGEFVIQPFTLNEFEDFVAQMQLLGEKGYKVRELDVNEILSSKSEWARFLQALFAHFGSFAQWADRFGRSRATVEEEVGYFLARYLRRPQLIPAPDPKSFGARYFYLFRGTTKGYPGHAAVSFCSISPVVSVSFAMKSEGNADDKILQIFSHLTLWRNQANVMDGNVMAGYEQEVIVSLAPLELSKLADKTISMPQAAQLLRDMGVPLPNGSKIDTMVHDRILLDDGRMSRFRVDSFVAKAFRLADAVPKASSTTG